MKQKKCILVIRFSSMGDVAMSVPVVREFCSKIRVLSWYSCPNDNLHPCLIPSRV